MASGALSTRGPVSWSCMIHFAFQAIYEGLIFTVIPSVSDAALLCLGHPIHSLGGCKIA